MEFYGTEKSVRGWKTIIETELGNVCGEVVPEPDRSVVSASFTVEMSKADRDFLQNNYWYAVEEGQDSPWNWRIGFVE